LGIPNHPIIPPQSFVRRKVGLRQKIQIENFNKKVQIYQHQRANLHRKLHKKYSKNTNFNEKLII